MIIRKEEVIAVNVQEQLYCIDCIKDTDMDNAEADDLVFENEDDDNFIFCDVCKKRIA